MHKGSVRSCPWARRNSFSCVPGFSLVSGRRGTERLAALRGKVGSACEEFEDDTEGVYWGNVQFWCWPTHVVLDKWPLNGCCCLVCRVTQSAQTEPQHFEATVPLITTTE